MKEGWLISGLWAEAGMRVMQVQFFFSPNSGNVWWKSVCVGVAGVGKSVHKGILAEVMLNVAGKTCNYCETKTKKQQFLPDVLCFCIFIYSFFHVFILHLE